MMIPAKMTPNITASTLDLKFISKILAASVPVQAPLPRNGMPTNINSATNNPIPAVTYIFLPPISQFNKNF